jgi:hypothetical protein
VKTLSYKQDHTPKFLSSRLLLSISFVIVIPLYIIVSITNAYAAQVTFAWDQNTESNLAGYKIYYGNSSRKYTRSVDVKDRTATTCTISDLIEGQTYYFAATAYNNSLVQSDYSIEVSRTINAATTTISPITTTTSLQPRTTTTVRPITSSSTSSVTPTTSVPTTSTTTVKPSKRRPHAKAGSNRIINLGTTVTLDGTKSYDLDGDPLQYFWQIKEAPGKYKLKNETTATLTFKPAEVGTYEVGLKVFDGTYYSEEVSVTITVEDSSSGNNSAKIWCPFFFLTNNDTEKIARLRDFRNNVLLKTPIGKKYVKLFYKNAIELITILINNEDVADQSKIVLDELLPKIKLAAAGQRINITPTLLLEIENILNQISIEASVELKYAIEKLKQGLKEEKILDEMGIEVNFLN